jgi:hypothetical protein
MGQALIWSLPAAIRQFMLRKTMDPRVKPGGDAYENEDAT